MEYVFYCNTIEVDKYFDKDVEEWVVEDSFTDWLHTIGVRSIDVDKKLESGEAGFYKI